MAQDQLKTILTYVKDVLGVDSFAIDQDFTVLTKPFLFVGSYSANQAVIIEMQTRMVSALKLDIKDVDFINLEQTNVQPQKISSAEVIVIFGDEAKKNLSLNDLKIGEVKSIASQKIIFTHSLTDLANLAPLKKET